MRVIWGKTERAVYIKEWFDRGYGKLPNPWEDYDIHHILPCEYGGSNNFGNLAPMLREAERCLFNAFWHNY